jgi:hypothetical protein
MKTTLSEYDFIRAFEGLDRVGNFGYDGLDKLFGYLEQLEDDTGEELELDVIGLCCGFTRHDSLGEYNEAYGTGYTEIGQVEQLACSIDGTAFITHEH